ncbi:MAG: C39 family peptidase [Clostridia bacterium]|nr:C39 family peptidase [Clostridia bacterium]
MKLKRIISISLASILLLLSVILIVFFKGCKSNQKNIVSDEFRVCFAETYKAFMDNNDLSIKDYPEEILALLERNAETEEFVLNYPLLKNDKPDVDISSYLKEDTFPYFKQWDTQWGYKKYGSGVMGLTGCGPTCLSMAAVYLLKDDKFDPAFVADMSLNNGYCVDGSGSSWKLISEGSAKIGLYSEEIPLHESTIIKHLSLGHPVICVMGPGDFTATGHFILITEHTENGFKLHDPNSIDRTNKYWSYETLAPQIKNLWAVAK